MSTLAILSTGIPLDATSAWLSLERTYFNFAFDVFNSMSYKFVLEFSIQLKVILVVESLYVKII